MTDPTGGPAVPPATSEILERAPLEALAAARATLAKDPRHLPSVQVAAAALRRLGQNAEADHAERAMIELAAKLPAIRAATQAIAEGRLREAEAAIVGHIQLHPNDPVALRLLAKLALRAGRPADAEALLRRSLVCAPANTAARKDLVALLRQNGRIDDAVAVLDERPASAAEAAELLYLKAGMLARVGRAEEAIAASTLSLELGPAHAVSWLGHARLLAQNGRRAEACDAARQAVSIDPEFGAGWWALADIDADAITDEDIAAMETVAAQPPGNEARRVPLHFALGRAWEARGQAQASFDRFAEGHAMRRRLLPHNAAGLSRAIARGADQATAGFFAERAGYGAPSHAPIFVVGMHRAGSTLIEQILASHPDVEGLGELPSIAQIVLGMTARHGGEGMLPEAIAALQPSQAAALGEAYLAAVRPFRRTDRPRFVDKMPGNWRSIPLIRLILPNATIVDARRNPLDCCISNFCRYFANGQEQVDDLADLGRYYRDYAAFMDRIDEALPAYVHRVRNEQLVDDPEGEVARLLEACGLSFDERCLRFFETERSIRTPSTTQVRRPVNRDGIGRWRLFAPWLAPLREALGPLAD